MNLVRPALLLLALLFGGIGPTSGQDTSSGMLVVEGGGSANELTRGWPVRLYWFALRSRAVSETLTLESAAGTSESVRSQPTGDWWLSPEQTLAFAVGPGVARVGQATLAVRFVDRPEPLSAKHVQSRRLARIRYALATGNVIQARTEAEAWVAAEPERATSHAVLGEVLAAQGEATSALSAFGASFARNVWTDRPPEPLMQQFNAVQEVLFEQFPRVPPEPLEEPEPTTLAEQDPAYLVDPLGQWAARATASSEYRTSGDYSASRATGAPDVLQYGDSLRAWASHLADSGTEWLELTFSNAVPARAVRVRQVFNPGAIVGVEVFDGAGTATTVFSGLDTNTYPANQIAWFVVRFPKTERPVQRVRITLDSARVKGWNEIDAVQLVAASAEPVAPPTLVFTLPSVAGTLEFPAWPSGFVLQRATRLEPANWEDHARQPPARVATGGGTQFFRLREAP